MGQRSRKRRREDGPEAGARTHAPAGERAGAPPADRASRSEAKDAAVRAGLEPLAEGERPGAVTVAAVLAFVLAAANVAAAVSGRELSSEGTNPVVFTAVTTAILVVAGVGMLRARYWAVLGFQVILGLQIIVFSLALLRAEQLWQAVVLVVLIGLLGYLFWKLVRAMARLQMPERRPRPPVQ